MNGYMRLVKIEWVDSRSTTNKWERLDDLDYMNACQCVSVGFLVKDEADFKMLVPNLADTDDDSDIQVSAVIVIPTCSITRMVSLAES